VTHDPCCVSLIGAWALRVTAFAAYRERNFRDIKETLVPRAFLRCAQMRTATARVVSAFANARRDDAIDRSAA
jgi:hypothetical protein